MQPPPPADFSSPRYWEARYSRSAFAPCDWYCNYEVLKPLLSSYLSRSADIELLIPGCGTSALPSALYRDGFKNISCIDSCPSVVQHAAQQHSAMEDMDFSVLDATALSAVLPPECFDFILDKALLDSLCCEEGGGTAARQLCVEMHRLLKPGGYWIVVSHAEPARRLPLFASGWMPRVHTITAPDAHTYYVYACLKPAL